MTPGNGGELSTTVTERIQISDRTTGFKFVLKICLFPILIIHHYLNIRKEKIISTERQISLSYVGRLFPTSYEGNLLTDVSYGQIFSAFRGAQGRVFTHPI